MNVTCRLVLLQGLGDEGPDSLLFLADLLCELLAAVLGQCCQLSCRLFQFGRVLRTTVHCSETSTLLFMRQRLGTKSYGTVVPMPMNTGTVLVCVVDQDPFCSETFSRIRIRKNQSGSRQLRIQIEFEDLKKYL
jgi:hypothetical protein